MSAIVTVADLKAYLRIRHGSEDELLASCLAAAHEQVETATGRTFPESDGGSPETFTTPERARQAVRAYAAWLWAERTPDWQGRDRKPPAHIKRLIDSLRDWKHE